MTNFLKKSPRQTWNILVPLRNSNNFSSKHPLSCKVKSNCLYFPHSLETFFTFLCAFMYMRIKNCSQKNHKRGNFLLCFFVLCLIRCIRTVAKKKKMKFKWRQRRHWEGWNVFMIRHFRYQECHNNLPQNPYIGSYRREIKEIVLYTIFLCGYDHFQAIQT